MMQMMSEGKDKPELITHELLLSLRENVLGDWAHLDSYGYW